MLALQKQVFSEPQYTRSARTLFQRLAARPEERIFEPSLSYPLRLFRLRSRDTFKSKRLDVESRIDCANFAVSVFRDYNSSLSFIARQFLYVRPIDIDHNARVLRFGAAPIKPLEGRTFAVLALQ